MSDTALDILSAFKQRHWNSIAHEFVRSHGACRAAPNDYDAAILDHVLFQCPNHHRGLRSLCPSLRRSLANSSTLTLGSSPARAACAIPMPWR